MYDHYNINTTSNPILRNRYYMAYSIQYPIYAIHFTVYSAVYTTHCTVYTYCAVYSYVTLQ